MINTWIKLTRKERMITELRWRMRGVAFYSMAARSRIRNRLSSNGQEDMSLHVKDKAIMNYCGKQCTVHPLNDEQTDTIFFASAGHEKLEEIKRLCGSEDEQVE